MVRAGPEPLVVKRAHNILIEIGKRFEAPIRASLDAPQKEVSVDTFCNAFSYRWTIKKQANFSFLSLKNLLDVAYTGFQAKRFKSEQVCFSLIFVRLNLFSSFDFTGPLWTRYDELL